MCSRFTTLMLNVWPVTELTRVARFMGRFVNPVLSTRYLLKRIKESVPCQEPMGIMEPSILVHCITGCGFPLAAHLNRILLPSCTEITPLEFNDGVISGKNPIFEDCNIFRKIQILGTRNRDSQCNLGRSLFSIIKCFIMLYKFNNLSKNKIERKKITILLNSKDNRPYLQWMAVLICHFRCNRSRSPCMPVRLVYHPFLALLDDQVGLHLLSEQVAREINKMKE